jgi:hypothetical protein
MQRNDRRQTALSEFEPLEPRLQTGLLSARLNPALYPSIEVKEPLAVESEGRAPFPLCAEAMSTPSAPTHL